MVHKQKKQQQYQMKKPDKIQQLNANLAAVSIPAKPKNAIRLEKHESAIMRRLDMRAACEFDIGKELVEIRQEEDYPESTFEEYIERRFGFTRSQGYHLISAHEVQAALPESVAPLLQTERQARALKSAPQGQRARILKAVAKDGPVTAKAIIAKTEEMSPIGDKVIEAEFTEVDKTGAKIPKRLQAEWDRANEEADAVLTPLRQAQRIMEEKIGNDKAWIELANTENSAMRKIVNEVSRVRPYAVCPTCKGREVTPKCRQCKGRGFVSKFLYTLATKEKKAKD